jgi:intein/homing endonuclease
VPSSIPNNYLLAAPDQRLELLSGILYAYRALYNKQRDRFSFFGKVYPLVKQIQYLAESLGLRTTLWHNEKCNEYILYFKSRIKLMEHQESPKIKVHTARRQIVAIEKIPAQMCVHIETEGADNSFLVGEGFISCL